MNVYKKLRVLQVVMGVLLAVFVMPVGAWGQEEEPPVDKSTVYWDYVNGNDELSGYKKQEPVKSFAAVKSKMDNTTQYIEIISPVVIDDTQTWDLSGYTNFSHFIWPENNEVPIITINSSLTLQNIKINNGSTKMPIFMIESGGNLFVNSNATITSNNGYSLPAIYSPCIEILSGGNAEINGGTVIGMAYYNSAQACINVAEGGTLKMTDGLITGKHPNTNFATIRGVNLKGTFEMSGGNISNCSQNSSHSDIRADGLYVYSTGKFTMTGGTIAMKGTHVPSESLYNVYIESGADVSIGGTASIPEAIILEAKSPESVPVLNIISKLENENIGSAFKVYPYNNKETKNKIMPSVIAKGAEGYSITAEDVARFTTSLPDFYVPELKEDENQIVINTDNALPPLTDFFYAVKSIDYGTPINKQLIENGFVSISLPGISKATTIKLFIHVDDISDPIREVELSIDKEGWIQYLFLTKEKDGTIKEYNVAFQAVMINDNRVIEKPKDLYEWPEQIVTLEQALAFLNGLKIKFVVNTAFSENQEFDVEWSYRSDDNNSSEFNPVYADQHIFTWTAKLPDDLYFSENFTSTGKSTIRNVLSALKPETEDQIVITGDGEFKKSSDDNTSSFNNIIGGDPNNQTTFQKLEIDGNADLTLNHVAISALIVNADKEASLLLEGENHLGDVINNGTLILRPIEGAELGYNVITNNGIFVDSTETVTKVVGTAGFEILETTKGKLTVEHGNNAQLKVDVEVEDISKTHFEWQKLNEAGEWETYHSIGTKAASSAGTLSVSESGTYRCLITYRTDGGASTTLFTQPVIVTVKSADKPPYIPPITTYYTVVLPETEGATLTPKPGNHTVEELYNFTFSIILDDDYNLSTPVVKANDVVIEPRASDGKYVIRSVEEDITVTISGIQKNTPTSNAIISSCVARIYALKGIVHFETPVSTDAWIVTLSGRLLRRIHLAPGSNQLYGLEKGIYIIRLSDGTKEKVQIR